MAAALLEVAHPAASLSCAAVPRAYEHGHNGNRSRQQFGGFGVPPGAITACASSSLFGGLTREAYRPFNWPREGANIIFLLSY